ncbi:ribosomal protein L1p/L10e family-domain-containing protein [Schizophyllum fasciatum]
MAADLIDGHVSPKQVEKAVNALLAYATKRAEQQAETELLPGRDQNVWLNIAEKTIVPDRRLKPHRIPLAHPIVDPRVSSICLLTKDPQRQYKDLLETHKIRFISRVVGVEKLKGKFKPFEARRGLLKDHDLFLADERIIPLLPKLLGTKFFKAKKQPIPVCLTRKDLKAELERAVSSTYMSQNQGTQTSVKIGTASQKPAHILDNLKTALPAIVARIKGGWENVQNVHIKTSSSTSLPIWSCDLSGDALGRWGGAADADVVMSDASGEESDAEEEDEEDAGAETAAPAARAKGKRRADASEESAQPKKRAKGAEGRALPSPASPAPKKAAKAAAEPASAKPSQKKARAPADVQQDDAAPQDAPSKKRKAKKGDAAATVESRESGRKAKKAKAGKKEAATPVPDVVIAADEAEATEKVRGEKAKKAKKAKAEGASAVEAAAAAAAAPASASKAAEADVDFKKKREGKSGEKKKEKVAKARPGKSSAKEGVLGKKALRA